MRIRNLERLARLRNSGALTREEFEEQKARLLADEREYDEVSQVYRNEFGSHSESDLAESQKSVHLLDEGRRHKSNGRGKAALWLLVTIVLSGAALAAISLSTGEAAGVARDASGTAARRPTSCYDVTNSEPQSLTGTLEYVMFAGPPNFEDVQEGDWPSPAYILRLDHDICIYDGDEGFADPDHMFTLVQIVPGKVNGQNLRRQVGRLVTIQLYDQMASQTLHHKADLVAWAAAISPTVSSGNQAPSESNPVAEYQVEEYGTPATTIRAFYAALWAGDGGVAAGMVVPEKTLDGPFSAANLTRFYGNMRSPVELINLTSMGLNTYQVQYRYAVSRSVCNGRAIVETTERNGKNYIARVRALDGC